jgi:hypothetical protein
MSPPLRRSAVEPDSGLPIADDPLLAEGASPNYAQVEPAHNGAFLVWRTIGEAIEGHLFALGRPGANRVAGDANGECSSRPNTLIGAPAPSVYCDFQARQTHDNANS